MKYNKKEIQKQLQENLYNNEFADYILTEYIKLQKQTKNKKENSKQ